MTLLRESGSVGLCIHLKVHLKTVLREDDGQKGGVAGWFGLDLQFKGVKMDLTFACKTCTL